MWSSSAVPGSATSAARQPSSGDMACACPATSTSTPDAAGAHTRKALTGAAQIQAETPYMVIRNCPEQEWFGLLYQKRQISEPLLKASVRNPAFSSLWQLQPRFRWLTAPRSTVVQTGPVHTGLTRDPDGEIDRLVAGLVLRPR
jgi:Protein of unknown function (DUF3037)